MFVLSEHTLIPGTTYEECLILDPLGSAILNEMELNEATDSIGRKILKFRGKFQEADAINKNKRMYTYDILNKNIGTLEESIKGGGLCGELDHPSDSIVHFRETSHKVTKLWWEGKTLMGEGQVLNTPNGKILRSLMEDGVRIGISSRGVGNGKVNEDGILVIDSSYKLITFDAVADPSTRKAFQKEFTAKESHVVHGTPIREEENEVKNETSSIHTNKQLLIACLGSIVKQEASRHKARLSNG